MNLEALKELIAHGEGPTLELKRSTAELREALQTVCAFLNTSGGKVIIGVKPDGTILGQQVSDKTLRDIAQMMQGFEPPIHFDVKRIRIKSDTEILVFDVPGEGSDVPWVYEGRAYERVQSTTRKMPQAHYEKLLLARTHSKRRWENQPAEGVSLKDIDRQEVYRIVQIAISQERLVGPMERDLGRLLDRLGVRKNGTIFRAAVVLFGKNFLPDFPQCHLMMARFKGTDKTEFMDQKALYGPAFKLLEEAQIFCQRHLPLPGKIVPEDFHRQDKPLIPPLALREILVNAFIHRDYSIAGGSIHLAIFDDRLEVWSAGNLPLGVTTAALSTTHDSVKRNPTIAATFYRTGLIEMWGRGTNRVIEQCRAAGIEPPTFREVDLSTVVTFRVPVSMTPQAGGQDRGQVGGQDRGQVGPHDKVILKFCRTPRTFKEIMDEIDIRRRKNAVPHLKALIQQGFLALTIPDKPQSRHQRYVTTPSGLNRLQLGDRSQAPSRH